MCLRRTPTAWRSGGTRRAERCFVSRQNREPGLETKLFDGKVLVERSPTRRELLRANAKNESAISG